MYAIRYHSLTAIKSAHFTVCQKPWGCHKSVYTITQRKNKNNAEDKWEPNPLCMELHRKYTHWVPFTLIFSHASTDYYFRIISIIIIIMLCFCFIDGLNFVGEQRSFWDCLLFRTLVPKEEKMPIYLWNFRMPNFLMMR